MCLSLHEQHHLHTHRNKVSLFVRPDTRNTMSVHICNVWDYIR
jgi:hypothetical protein